MDFARGFFFWSGILFWGVIGLGFLLGGWFSLRAWVDDRRDERDWKEKVNDIETHKGTHDIGLPIFSIEELRQGKTGDQERKQDDDMA